MPRILVRAHKPPERVADAATTLRENLIGGNVGNLVFSQATFRLLSRPGTRLGASPLGRSRVPARVRAELISARTDHVVLPLANAFRSSHLRQLEALTDLIEHLRVPVTVLGVGAQAKLSGRYGGASKVAEPARRFVAAVLRRSPSVGVRGEFTYDFVRGLGFGEDEVQVIGCPSLFMHGPDLPALRSVDHLDRDSPIALTVSPYVAAMGPLSLRCAEQYPRLHYLAQNRQTLGLLLTGHYPLADSEAEQSSSGVPVGLDHPLLQPGRTRFPLDPTTWFAELTRYDFAFGSRIHGTIAALLAGTPAVLLAHDARTLELARYHAIPYVRITDAGSLDPADLYAAQDWSPLHQAHPDRWRTFAAFLAQHGLPHTYDPGGDRGAVFDDRLAHLTFPPMVTS